MKKVTTLILITITAFFCKAQNVGIGLDNPAAKLTIFDSGLSGALFQNNTTGISASNGFFVGLKPNSKNAILMNFEVGSLVMGTNNNEYIHVNSIGYVGIGGVPNHKFDVNGIDENIMDISGGNKMYITLSENGVKKGYIGSYNQSTSVNDVDFGTYSTSNGALHLITQSIPRLTVANNGNIGIGNTAPAYKFDVTGFANIEYLGIGTAIPNVTYPLDIGGNSRFSGKILVNSNKGIVRSSNGTQLITEIFQTPANLNLSWGAGQSGTIAVAFSNTYSSPPTVSVGNFVDPGGGSSFSGLENLVLVVTDVTTTGANIRVKNVGNSTATMVNMILKCIVIGPE